MEYPQRFKKKTKIKRFTRATKCISVIVKHFEMHNEAQDGNKRCKQNDASMKVKMKSKLWSNMKSVRDGQLKLRQA